MKIVAAALLLAATLAAPASAHADDVPTVDQVVAIMAELTDPNRAAASKSDVVIPGFSPDEAGSIDGHLNQMRDALPLNFIVTNIQPAPDNFAGATIQTAGSFRQTSAPGPIVLASQNGHWLLSHDSAKTALDNFWYNANRPHWVYAPPARG
jgi:hypothetical protein